MSAAALGYTSVGQREVTDEAPATRPASITPGSGTAADLSGPLQRLVGPFTSIGTVVQATSSLSPKGGLFHKIRIAHITHPVTIMVTRPVLKRRCPTVGKRTDLDLFTITPNKYETSDSKTIIIGGKTRAGKSLPGILEDMSSRKE